MFNRYLPPTYATPHPTPSSCPESFEFADSCVESREQLDLKCFMGCFGNGINFTSDNVNEIVYDNEYEHSVLLSIRTSDTPLPASTILNEVNNDQFISLVNASDNEEDNYIESNVTRNVDASEVINAICEAREVPYSNNFVRPDPCTNDLCACVYAEVQECSMNTCYPNGCDQYMDDYFKKDYHYPCASCKDTFGNCTDFSGSQQGENSARSYDHDCDNSESDNADTETSGSGDELDTIFSGMNNLYEIHTFYIHLYLINLLIVYRKRKSNS